VSRHSPSIVLKNTKLTKLRSSFSLQCVIKDFAKVNIHSVAFQAMGGWNLQDSNMLNYFSLQVLALRALTLSNSEKVSVNGIDIFLLVELGLSDS